MNSDICFHSLMQMGLKIDDMVMLWTQFRGVSKAFKDAVERVFILRHLNKIYLIFDGGAYICVYCMLERSSQLIYAPDLAISQDRTTISTGKGKE